MYTFKMCKFNKYVLIITSLLLWALNISVSDYSTSQKSYPLYHTTLIAELMGCFSLQNKEFLLSNVYVDAKTFVW